MIVNREVVEKKVEQESRKSYLDIFQQKKSSLSEDLYKSGLFDVNCLLIFGNKWFVSSIYVLFVVWKSSMMAHDKKILDKRLLLHL